MEIAMQVNDYENGVCPEWLRVERIVSHKGGDGAPDDGTKYLVKWEVLGYQECTWEAAEDLADEAVRHLIHLCLECGVVVVVSVATRTGFFRVLPAWIPLPIYFQRSSDKRSSRCS